MLGPQTRERSGMSLSDEEREFGDGRYRGFGFYMLIQVDENLVRLSFCIFLADIPLRMIVGWSFPRYDSIPPYVRGPHGGEPCN